MTCLHQVTWPPSGSTYRRAEDTVLLGTGDAVWKRASEAIVRWEVKTASGFSVDTTAPVTPGQRLTVTAHLFGLAVKEPVEVVDVLDEPTRCGFSYRTLPGHPVDGEEAFFIHRHGEDVHLTIRSLTRASSAQPWRLIFPLLLVAQRMVRKRYLRALL